MIYITGDTHGDFKRFSSKNFYEQREMSKDDYVIICGDFGGVWAQTETNTEKYWLNWLNDKPFTTLFVDGNHCNHNRLDNYPVEFWKGGKVHKIRSNVIHLMRGQVFHIDGMSFFAFGGASSHDIQDGILDLTDFPDEDDYRRTLRKWEKENKVFRIKDLTWWERELPSNEEMDEGLVNLLANNNQVDFIITHSPYTSILEYLDPGLILYKTDRLTDYLQEIKETVDYKKWFFGHMHINENFKFDNSICLYEQIIRIV